jgi:hypothetical protein
MAAKGLHPLGAGAQAMLPFLTIGGLMVLGWRLWTITRGNRAARQLAPADTRPDRGRTIYRNTPS